MQCRLDFRHMLLYIPYAQTLRAIVIGTGLVELHLCSALQLTLDQQGPTTYNVTEWNCIDLICTTTMLHTRAKYWKHKMGHIM